MRADAGFHADQAWRHVGKARFYLAARPLLSQHDGTTLIVADNMERVFANIDADHGVNVQMTKMLTDWFAGKEIVAPSQHSLLVGREHGRTIPLSDIGPSPCAALYALMKPIWRLQGSGQE